MSCPKRPPNVWVHDLMKKAENHPPMTEPQIHYAQCRDGTGGATYIYLEDVSFRHDRINAYVTLYRARDDDRIVGFMVGDR